MPTERRLERLQKEILRELSHILQHELNDPRLGLISLTRVKLSPDLKIAQVYCSIFGGAEEWPKVNGGLQHARGYVQKTLGGRLSIRFAPEIVFHHDRSIEKSIRIGGILDDLEGERRERTSGGEEE